MNDVFQSLAEVPAILLMIAGLLLFEAGASGRSIFRRLAGSSGEKMSWLSRSILMVAGVTVLVSSLFLLQLSRAN
ncbi:MAG: hypothetical protein R3245_08470 [Kiloniellales bacterium]|nr:hypothetical protein [Kiloniellales bacterium]